MQGGVIKNISKFLAYLSPPCRSSYLPLLHDFLHSSSPFNWRMREHLAAQLSDLLLLPHRTSMCVTLFPLIMALLQDPVSCVRHASFKGVSKLILLLDELVQTSKRNQLHQKERERDSQQSAEDGTQHEENNTQDNNTDSADDTATYGKECLIRVVQSINMFVTEDVYQRRLLWLELAHQLLKDLPRKLFEMLFIEGLVHLTADPVCNVRVGVSRVLSGWEPEFPMPTMEEILDNGQSNNGCAAEHCSIETTTEANQTCVAEDGSSDAPLAASTPVNPYIWLLRRTDIRECVKRLSVDDLDVYVNMVKLSGLFPAIEFKSTSCRGMKCAPGGAIPPTVMPNENLDEDDDFLNDSLSITVAAEDTMSRDSQSSIESDEEMEPSRTSITSLKSGGVERKRSKSTELNARNPGTPVKMLMGSPIDASSATAYLSQLQPPANTFA